MFAETAVFNRDLSKWDVSSVTNMVGMFAGAKAFRRKLCGAAWVLSEAKRDRMFEKSRGSISTTVCTTPKPRRGQRDRDLIARTTIATPSVITSTNTMTCRKCGKFKRSGRVSCCAPGGTWYKNCGGFGNRDVEHMWSDGVEACTPRTASIISSACILCGTIGKSGRRSCCGRGGSWFRNCGSAGNAKVDHTWYEGIQACKTQAQSQAAISHQLNAD